MFTRIRNARDNAIAAVIIPIAYHADRKIQRIQQKEYDRMIAESQAKIGPYTPASIPVQVWA